MTSHFPTERRGVVAGVAMLLLASSPAVVNAEESAAATAGAQSNVGQLDVKFEGLRSARGYLRACLTQDRTHFPKCEKDPAALTASVAAGNEVHLTFARVPPGDYALLVFHDENGNSKMDTMLGIPREGVGFSRNPKLSFGAPRFDAVVISVPAGPTKETAVKMKYFL